jgi:hypothetical protein
MLPYLDPEDDVYINMCILLKMIGILSRTNRGSLKLNNKRVHIYLYLIKNPMALNRLLLYMGKGNVNLRKQKSYSISSLSQNIDPLFDRDSLKKLISILISKKFIDVTYKKEDGFFYSLTEEGERACVDLSGEYLLEVSQLCEKLKVLQSTPESKLNLTIKKLIRTEAA